MKRVFILLLDSFGLGASQDAKHYHDEGADTLGHIATQCAEGQADSANLRTGPLSLPHLTRLGLHRAALASTGKRVPGLETENEIKALYGYGVERSHGKDTQSGHWEIAGAPVLFDWGYFPPDYPSFPSELIDQLIQRGNIPGVLGNKHASGTVIINDLGEEHIKTGKPIVYTSADSVFQIAAHEEHFGLERLYALCTIARELVDPYRIGRVIARPFIGTAGNFVRTENRHDLATPPHKLTLLNYLKAAKKQVIAIGKIADIFAGQGITKKIPAKGNKALFDATIQAAKEIQQESLIFTNFVDFDSKFGHRRDVAGYANALEAFDARLQEFQATMQKDDIAIITADHGCDPTFRGTDHTREHIPILVFGPSIQPRFIGRRESFADIGQSITSYFGIEALDYGISFL